VSNNSDTNEQVKVQKDLLWGLYIELRNHARHSELLRARVNNYVLLVSSILITLTTVDKEVNRDDLSLTLIMILVGIVGTAFSFSYTERYDRNRARAFHIIKQIDSIFFEGKSSKTLNALNVQADGQHFKSVSYKIIKKLSNTHWFWITLPLSVSFIGFILTIFSYFNI